MSLLLLKAGGAGSAFSPGDLAEAVVWADSRMTGDEMQLTTNLIDSWGASSLTQLAGDVVRPTLEAGIVTYASDQSKATAVSIGTFDIFAVANMNNPSSVRVPYEHSEDWSTNPGHYFIVSSGTWYIGVNRGGVKSQKQSGTMVDTGWHIYHHQFDGTNAGHRILVDGIDAGFTNAALPANDPGAGSVSDTLFVGSRGTSRQFPMDNMKIESILVCSPALSAGDVVHVMEYLQANSEQL